ncbi:MAG: alpha-galactosidase, partial [Prevotella sp.]|nr:alpha-galactosidase [Prevotella sp.]
MKKNLLVLLAAIPCIVSAQKAAPMMGWSSWNTYGVHISETLICHQAKCMANSGLKAAGYTFINIDDGFQGGRDKDGNLKINPYRFPKGLKPVADFIHAQGLK